MNHDPKLGAGATPEPPTPAKCPPHVFNYRNSRSTHKTCDHCNLSENYVNAVWINSRRAVTSSGAQPPDLTVRGSDEERAAHQLQVLEDWRGATQGSSPREEVMPIEARRETEQTNIAVTGEHRAETSAEVSQGSSPATWVSIADRLPEVGWVLTHEKMTSGSERVRWFGENGKFVEPRTIGEGGDVDCTYFVTHWMPLPTPPSSEGAQGSSVSATKERADFEKWVTDMEPAYAASNLERLTGGRGGYRVHNVAIWWMAWEARAGRGSQAGTGAGK